MTQPPVFVVSDDPAIRDSLSELIASADLHAECYPSLDAWLGAVSPEREGCLVLDAREIAPGGPGPLARFTATCASRAVLLLIDRGDVPLAVRAIKDGAADVLEMPCRDEDLIERIRGAMARSPNAVADREFPCRTPT